MGDPDLYNKGYNQCKNDVLGLLKKIYHGSSFWIDCKVGDSQITGFEKALMAIEEETRKL